MRCPRPSMWNALHPTATQSGAVSRKAICVASRSGKAMSSASWRATRSAVACGERQVQRIDDAAVVRPDHLDPRVLCREPREKVRRRVGGAVVDDDQAQVRHRLREHRAQRFFDRGRRVVDRDQDVDPGGPPASRSVLDDRLAARHRHRTRCGQRQPDRRTQRRADEPRQLADARILADLVHRVVDHRLHHRPRVEPVEQPPRRTREHRVQDTTPPAVRSP